jgi:hypothetical protein
MDQKLINGLEWTGSMNVILIPSELVRIGKFTFEQVRNVLAETAHFVSIIKYSGKILGLVIIPTGNRYKRGYDVTASQFEANKYSEIVLALSPYLVADDVGEFAARSLQLYSGKYYTDLVAMRNGLENEPSLSCVDGISSMNHVTVFGLGIKSKIDRFTQVCKNELAAISIMSSKNGVAFTCATQECDSQDNIKQGKSELEKAECNSLIGSEIYRILSLHLAIRCALISSNCCGPKVKIEIKPER